MDIWQLFTGHTASLSHSLSLFLSSLTRFIFQCRTENMSIVIERACGGWFNYPACPDLAKFWHFGQITNSLTKDLEHLFSIWHNFQPTLQKILWYWARCHCCKRPKIERNIQPCGHTGSWLNGRSVRGTFRRQVSSELRQVGSQANK